MSKTFSARLNRLFDTVYPPGRGPHTSAEVIAALKAEGVTMSAPYLSQLRSGNRTNPSAATMAALANFFRIKPAYFTDDEYYEKLDKELTWLANMRDEGVRRIAARTVGLSVARKSTSCVAGSTWTISPPHAALRRLANLGNSAAQAVPSLEIASWRYCCAISRIHSRSENVVGWRSQPSPGKVALMSFGASSLPS
jgi:hypothetical protein